MISLLLLLPWEAGWYQSFRGMY